MNKAKLLAKNVKAVTILILEVPIAMTLMMVMKPCLMDFWKSNYVHMEHTVVTILKQV